MTLKEATPLSVVLTLLLSAAYLITGSPQTAGNSTNPQRKQGNPLPTIVVEACCPGANAVVVRDVVAAPIEEQVKGVKNLLHLASRSTNDGRYILTATFKPGTNLDAAHTSIQNRVALALPALPDAVQRYGVAIRKKSPVMMIVSLSAPTDRHDVIFLSNYALIYIKDELTRLAGVGDIALFGQRDYSMRVWLDPQKLTARNLMAVDVQAAIASQNVKVMPGQIGQPPDVKGFPIQTLGRLSDPEGFSDIIVKAGEAKPEPIGNIIRLKDVGRVELGAESSGSDVRCNGKPCVALGVYPIGGTNAKEVSRAVADKLAQIRARLPEGLRLEVAFDFAANLENPRQATTRDYLLLDLALQDNASAASVLETFTACEKLLRNVPGVQDLLALSENPFDVLRNQPCILVRLTPAGPGKMSRQEIMRTIRTKLEKVPNASLRLRELSSLNGSHRHGYPIELAVSGPEPGKVRELAEKFGELLHKSKKLTDVWVSRESTHPQLLLDIDRTKAASLGVTQAEIFTTLQVYLGSFYVNNFIEFGRTWQVVVQADKKFVHADKKSPERSEDLKQLQLRNDKGQMIRLATLATVRTVDAPRAIYLLDSRPAVAVSANPAAEVSLEQARALCEAQFNAVRQELQLPDAYRLTWPRAD